MTAVFTVHLQCQCDCAHLNVHGCHVSFPDRPAEQTAKEVREHAAAKGWETLRHTKGRDICPPCRIAEIRAVAELEETP